MQKRSTILHTCILLIALLIAGCKKHLKELNVDPTGANSENFNPNFLLSSAQLRYTGSVDFGYDCYAVQLGYLSTAMQHFATATNPDWPGDKYIVDPLSSSQYFTAAYSEQVKFVVDGLHLAKDKPQFANLYQILRIWKVVIFHRITDLYGDVPYFKAGLGYLEQALNPEYDLQQMIYTDMLKELREAAAALDVARDIPSGDFIYKGSASKWKKLAYSMMLRLGMRLTKVDPVAAKAWTEEAVQGGVFSSVDQNAFILHDATGARPTVNRISNNFVERGEVVGGGKWSKTLIDFLKENSDPRLPVLSEVASVNGTGTNESYGSTGDTSALVQIGMPNGFDLATPNNIANEPNYPGAANGNVIGKYSRPRHTLFLKASSPTFIITYAETELLLAEAKKLGFAVSGTVEEHYNAGVRAAMENLKNYDAAAAIPGAKIQDYLGAHPYEDASGLKMIGEQYWIATLFNEYETFAYWRRTGYPQLQAVNHPNSNTAGKIPRRMMYPESEAASNANNFQQAVSRMGGVNSVLARVWWDKE